MPTEELIKQLIKEISLLRIRICEAEERLDQLEKRTGREY